MDDLWRLLNDHKRRYPELSALDLVKLIYQNEFGSGHFIKDEGASLARLEREVSQLQPSQTELFESIGNGLVRLHLQGLNDALSLKTVNRFFVLTAAKQRGSIEQFETKLKVLRDFWPAASLHSFLEEYKKEGYPPMSHSERYKEHYNPSYRVVNSEFALYFPLFKRVEELLQNEGPHIVAIDGRSSSGKTTLGQLLKGVYGCPVISMDHFFLRPEQRIKERLEEPGGNVDYERFALEVMPKLKGNDAFRYKIYNCQTQGFTSSPVVEPHPLTIVEGCYSHHPTLVENWDLKVFLTVSPEVQRERILKRNGPSMLRRFVGEWIPLEEHYFDNLDISSKSHLVLNTGVTF